MSTTWRQIQSHLGITVDGVPGSQTASAVGRALGLTASAEKIGGEPLWLTKARDYIGTKEIPGPAHNQTVLRWWELIKAPFRDDETAWCAGFVGGVLEECGIKSSRSAAARSYLKWGAALKVPRQGAITVFWRGNRNGWSGHVGFCVGVSKTGDPWVLGGNQGNEVNIRKFSKSRLLGYQWPTGTNEFPAQYPVRTITTAGAFSSNEA